MNQQRAEVEVAGSTRFQSCPTQTLRRPPSSAPTSATTTVARRALLSSLVLCTHGRRCRVLECSLRLKMAGYAYVSMTAHWSALIVGITRQTCCTETASAQSCRYDPFQPVVGGSSVNVCWTVRPAHAALCSGVGARLRACLFVGYHIRIPWHFNDWQPPSIGREPRVP